MSLINTQLTEAKKVKAKEYMEAVQVLLELANRYTDRAAGAEAEMQALRIRSLEITEEIAVELDPGELSKLHEERRQIQNALQDLQALSQVSLVRVLDEKKNELCNNPVQHQAAAEFAAFRGDVDAEIEAAENHYYAVKSAGEALINSHPYPKTLNAYANVLTMIQNLR